MTQARLILHRPGDDGPAVFSVRVDAKKVGTIDSGGKLLLTMPAGSHRLQLRFAYITSLPLDIEVAEGQRLDLRVARAYGFGPWDLRYLTRRRSAISVEAGRSDA